MWNGMQQQLRQRRRWRRPATAAANTFFLIFICSLIYYLRIFMFVCRTVASVCRKYWAEIEMVEDRARKRRPSTKMENPLRSRSLFARINKNIFHLLLSIQIFSCCQFNWNVLSVDFRLIFIELMLSTTKQTMKLNRFVFLCVFLFIDLCFFFRSMLDVKFFHSFHSVFFFVAQKSHNEQN